MAITSLSPTVGLQSFVDQTTNVIVATSTAGAPASGQFYSQIVGRASMPDISKNLKVQMGVERIIMQTIFLIPGEMGPSQEPVYGVVNDTYGQIGLVGWDWAASGLNSNQGSTQVQGNTIN